MNWILLLDCAFSFYQNYPCRLLYAEMECEFPCDESVYNSPQPFGEPNFRSTRETSISEAFQSLFEEYPKKELSPFEQNTPVKSYESIRMGLRVFDMFTLIHREFDFLNSLSKLTVYSSLCFHQHAYDTSHSFYPPRTRFSGCNCCKSIWI